MPVCSGSGQIETEIAVDSEGHFEVELCEGVRYSAFAFSGSPKNISYSEPIELQPEIQRCTSS